MAVRGEQESTLICTRIGHNLGTFLCALACLGTNWACPHGLAETKIVLVHSTKKRIYADIQGGRPELSAHHDNDMDPAHKELSAQGETCNPLAR